MKKLVLLLFVPFFCCAQICSKINVNERFKEINEDVFLDAIASGLVINLEWDENKTISWLRELSSHNAQLYIPTDNKGFLNWNSNLIISSGENIFDEISNKVGEELCKFNTEISESKILILGCNFSLVKLPNLEYLEVIIKTKTLWNNQVTYAKQFLIKCDDKRLFVNLKSKDRTINLDEVLIIKEL